MCNNRVVAYDEQSVILHVFLRTLAGAPCTFTTPADDFQIAVLRVGEGTSAIKQYGPGSVQAISTIGTYQAPATNKVRFSPVHTGIMPGWYEMHLDDALFSSSGSPRSLSIGITYPDIDMQPEGYAVQIRPQPVDLVRVDGSLNASATLKLKGVEIVGNTPANSVVVIKNTSNTANSHAVSALTVNGSPLTLDNNNSASPVLAGLKLNLPTTNRTAWDAFDWLAVTSRYVGNKMVISKTAATMTLFDDNNAMFAIQNVTDDGMVQTRTKIP